MSTYEVRVKELRKRLSGSDLNGADTLWITQPENRRYLSGFRASDPQPTESSGSLLIGEKLCLLITDSRYSSEAQEEAIDFDVHTASNGLPEVLPELLKAKGTKRLGFEEYYVSYGLYREIKEKLASLSVDVILLPMENVVEEMRETKDDEELKYMQRSADLISSVMEEVIEGLNPGITEREVAWRIEGLVRDGGAEGMAFSPIVASGPNSAMPHAVPSNRRLKKGEPIIIDAGARVEGYCSDITRTVFLGDPDSQFKDIYRIVREAQVAALGVMKEGAQSTYADNVARDVISKAGFGSYFGHGLGHGVGLATHEGPRLGPRKPVALRKNMVVTVEPGIYLPGQGGVRLEEMLLILENGVKVLTKGPDFYDPSH